LNPENETRDDSDSSTSAESSSSSIDTTPAASSSTSINAVPATSGSTTVSAAPVEAGAISEPTTSGRREDRRNWTQNVNLTFEFIGKISRDKKLHFRSSDQLTSKLLIGSFLLAVGFATLPFFEMNAIAAFAYVLADAMLMCAITVFVVSRFGIIRAMEPRHALVCWHLMVGTGLLALVIGFNVVATVVLFMMRERLPLLFHGG